MGRCRKENVPSKISMVDVLLAQRKCNQTPVGILRLARPAPQCLSRKKSSIPSTFMGVCRCRQLRHPHHTRHQKVISQRAMPDAMNVDLKRPSEADGASDQTNGHDVANGNIPAAKRVKVDAVVDTTDDTTLASKPLDARDDRDRGMAKIKSEYDYSHSPVSIHVPRTNPHIKIPTLICSQGRG